MSKARKGKDGLQIPKSLEAEQAVLGGIMIAQNQQAAWLAVDYLEEKDFWLADHQLIWRALAHLCGQQQPADAVTLGVWMESNGIDALVGGSAYILELAQNTPSAANIAAYAAVVAEKSRARKLMDVGAEITQAASGGMESREIALRYQGSLLALSDNPAGKGAVGMDQVLRETWVEISADYENKGPRGLLMPWSATSRYVPSVRPGELEVVCGRPGMGKSTYVWQRALIASMHHKIRVFGSTLEMSKPQLGRRWLSNITQVPLQRLLNPTMLQDEDWPKITNGVELLKALGSRMVIDDTRGITIAQFCSRVRREHLREPIGLAVFDLFNRAKFPGKNRLESMEEGAVMLKDLAGDINGVVIVLAQVNRDCEKRPDKRPMASDLKSCGALEENADWIHGLYRDEVYNRDSPAKGVCEDIIIKARDGECGTAKLKWRGDCSRIDDFEFGELPPELPIESAEKKRKARFY